MCRWCVLTDRTRAASDSDSVDGESPPVCLAGCDDRTSGPERGCYRQDGALASPLLRCELLALSPSQRARSTSSASVQRSAMRASRSTVRGLQVIVSLLLSSIMLGKQGTSLVAIIRTTNRKQELQMLVGELTRARSSSIPQELLARARRATELGEPGTELVRRPLPH